MATHQWNNKMCKSPSPPTQSNPGKSTTNKVDPITRALNTLLFGLLIHFGTIWSIEQYNQRKRTPSTTTCTSWNSTPSILLLHEYWVYLQHTNVLANPHLQHLDRQYGIALLRNNQHWAIAGTLSSYWCRETVGMFLTLPFLQPMEDDDIDGDSTVTSFPFSMTQYLILYSIIYHTVKSRGVRSDAIRRHSTKFGIMRIVIDRFFTDSLEEFMISLGRLFLQGFDTYIHFCIVRDMVLLLGSQVVMTWIHILFAVWVMHASMNQLFQRSTASLIVQIWHFLTAKPSKDLQSLVLDVDLNAKAMDQTIGLSKFNDYEEKASFIECNSPSSSCTSYSSEDMDSLLDSDDKFVVRQLLHPSYVPHFRRGRDGSASAGVDKAVRIETAIAIVSAFFMIGLGRNPIEALRGNYSWMGVIQLQLSNEQIYAAGIISWLLWSVLHGLWLILLKSRRQKGSDNHRFGEHWQSVLNLADMTIVIAAQTLMLPGKTFGWLVCASLTVKSFSQAQRKKTSKLFRWLISGIEFISKVALLRALFKCEAQDDSIVLLTSVVTILWLIWVVSNSIPTPCEVASDTAVVADAVFLSHPAELSDFWALWLIPYSLEERWKPPFWAHILWPFHYVAAIYLCKYRRRLFGDKGSYICCENVCYGQTRIQNWVASHFGRHFSTHTYDVKCNIEAAARYAENSGVKVFCLGALNKAEGINGGGVSLVRHLGPNRRLSIIHGNHLTAAAVIETILQCFCDKKTKFFLTGASSKVGWAVAQALKECGYEVLCHSTDKARRQFFRTNQFASASTLTEGAAFTSNWIVGKYDKAVAREIPQNSVAVVFSVPHPLIGRKDVRIIEAGTLHMDQLKLDRPRLFSNKLRANEIYACHAASIVAVHRLRTGKATRIDEVGPVDIKEMNSWLDDAKALGFRVPRYESVTFNRSSQYQIDPVVIVGAGPAGLCAAAGLSTQNIPFIILDAETNAETFGSWNVLSRVGANVTTQKKWCNLTGYDMNDQDFQGDYVSAEEYQCYLKQYANRFSITNHIHRGVRVVSVEKYKSEAMMWKVTMEKEGELRDIFGSSVIVATGKHRVARTNTTCDIVSKLVAGNIRYVHSTEMTSENWKRAYEAARNGTLCIVGFGNSASDIATGILQNFVHQDETKPLVHISARTVPPVFPQQMSFLRVDSIGYLLQWLPLLLQEFIIRLLWKFIPTAKQCNSSFPSHLKRWNKVHGRIPVIDKGYISSGFASEKLIGHGPILDIDERGGVIFADTTRANETGRRIKIEMAILAIGYEDECVVDREDRPSGLYKLGFGNDNFLPLNSICKDAASVVEDICRHTT